MTLAVLRGRVQSRAQGYATAQIDAAINEGLKLFSLVTLCVERGVAIQLQADKPVMRILDRVSDFLAPLRVRCLRRTSAGLWDIPLWDSELWNGPTTPNGVTNTPVRPVRLADLAALNPAWRNERDGTVTKYGVQGADVLFIYPTPEDENTALSMVYAAQAETLVNDGDVPEIPEEYHPALISYTLATLPLAFGGVELQQFAPEWDKYVAAVQECAEWFRARSRAQQYDSAPAELVLADKGGKPKEKR